MKQKVIVTGATGKTGRLVVRELLKRPDEFDVQGHARFPTDYHQDAEMTKLLPPSVMHYGDIRNKKLVKNALAGNDALIMCTSSGIKMSTTPSLDAICRGDPSLYYFDVPPEEIDWIGRKVQVEAAQELGLEDVVMVSSMGGLRRKDDPFAWLNEIDNAKMPVWKRRAEEFLVESGMSYTIIRAGACMLMDATRGGHRKLVAGKNDELVNSLEAYVPREDLARTAVQALRYPEAECKCFDLGSEPEGVGHETVDNEDFQVGADEADPPRRLRGGTGR